MILLQAHNISKSYGSTQILSNIQLEIHTGDRVGLVGVNGAGKSTLLKILVAESAYDEGDIFKAKETSIGYLAQSSGLSSTASIWEEMLSVFADIIEQEQQVRYLEQEMSNPQVLANVEEYQKLIEEYAHLSQLFTDNEGYQYEAMIRNVLHGLKFADKDYSDSISTLSGGQKTRLALAKLLLQKPDILVLDEPTNYLDLETLAWLESYLNTYPGAILVVSHDRYFLDALVNVVYEIERTKSTKYYGNYSKFLEHKAAQAEQQAKQFKKQQQDIQKLEEFIQRNLVRASTTKRAQSRRKQLDKMERMDKPLGHLKKASFSFDIDRQSGNDVLKVENVAVGYSNDNPLSQHVSFYAYRGDSIAIVGPNGIGKTTLLKTIVGQLPSLSGTIYNGTNVSIAYYDQEQHHLHAQKTIQHEIWDDYPQMLEKEVRSLLGQFLFSGDDVGKSVQDLSGGEKARLSLAKLILQHCNLLILDEPTNHLDLYSKEVLEEALLDYPGTILFVSHDRYFLNRIATKVIELRPDGAEMFLGDYDYYVHKKKELEEISLINEQEKQVDNVESVEQSAKATYEQEKERQKMERQLERKKNELEQKMESLEEQISHWEAELCLPEVYQDYEQSLEIQSKLEETKKELESLFEEWSIMEED